MLGKKYRLTGRERINLVKTKGRRVYSPSLSAAILPNDVGHQRYTFVVSTYVSKLAVHRNRIRRALSESARRQANSEYPMVYSYDVVILAKATIGSKITDDILKEGERLLNKVYTVVRLISKNKLPQ
jgi:ribonuclease P protein component